MIVYAFAVSNEEVKDKLMLKKDKVFLNEMGKCKGFVGVKIENGFSVFCFETEKERNYGLMIAIVYGLRTARPIKQKGIV